MGEDSRVGRTTNEPKPWHELRFGVNVNDDLIFFFPAQNDEHRECSHLVTKHCSKLRSTHHEHDDARRLEGKC